MTELQAQPADPAVAWPVGHAEWDREEAGYFYEDLTPGLSARLARRLGREEVAAFARLSGDDNPIHIDPAVGSRSRFGGCVAHGMLTGGLFSALIGTRLPGRGAIYLSQSLSFHAPVMVGETVVAAVEIVEILPRGRVRLACTAHVGDRLVADGEAVVLVPRRP